MANTESPLLGRKMRCHCGVRVSKAVMSKLIGCHSNIRNGSRGQCTCHCVCVRVSVERSVTFLPPPRLKVTLALRPLKLLCTNYQVEPRFGITGSSSGFLSKLRLLRKTVRCDREHQNCWTLVRLVYHLTAIHMSVASQRVNAPLDIRGENFPPKKKIPTDGVCT